MTKRVSHTKTPNNGREGYNTEIILWIYNKAPVMNYRNIMLSCFGNVLEWFDYALFIYLAPIIGTQFFHLNNPFDNQLAAFGVFAAGFFFRPVGGLFFGYYGDKLGRAFSLRWSIISVSACTLLIGLLPNQAHWGIIASILFVLLRLVQGFCIGGEFGGAMVFLAENASPTQRGFFMSFAVAGSSLGFVLAIITMLILPHFFSPAAITQHAWRLPFIFAGCVGSVISYYRLRFLETPLFSAWLKKHPGAGYKLFPMLKKNAATIVYISLFTCMGAPAYYVFFGFLPTYLVTHSHLTHEFPNLLEIPTLLSMAILVPFAGMLSDRIGRREMVYATIISQIICYVPLFFLLDQTNWLALSVAFFIIMLLLTAQQGGAFPAMIESTPIHARYTLIALSYNIGNGIFGGITPFIVALLAHHFGHYAIAGYLIAMTLMALWAFCQLDTTVMLKETQSIVV